jgi:hypothetical protein
MLLAVPSFLFCPSHREKKDLERERRKAKYRCVNYCTSYISIRKQRKTKKNENELTYILAKRTYIKDIVQYLPKSF